MPAVKRPVTALAVVLLAAVALVTTAAPGLGVSRQRDNAAAPLRVTSSMRGHGEFAVISKDHHLYLIGGAAHGVRTVSFAGEAHRPQWSHDGRWLAVTVTAIPPQSRPNADEPTTVWLVSRTGRVVRRLTPSGQPVYHAEVAWSPRADKAAISYTVGPPGVGMRLDVVDTGGRAATRASAALIAGFAWSPDGLRLAVSLNNAPRGTWHSRLVSVRVRNGATRTITADVGDVFEVAGWWPKGSGVLVWLDPQGSAAPVPDGLPLLTISAATGQRRQLTNAMLTYSGWLATSKLKDEVAFIAGGDRVLTNGHKHLVVCTRARCRAVSQPQHQVSFDPAWSRDGRLAVVRDAAVRPTVANGYYSMTFTRKVDASGGIDVLRGRHVHRLAGGAHATAPVWGRDGSRLEVRGTSLWLVRAAGGPPQRVAGPLDTSDNFYGFVSWWDSFAWTGAVAS